ncbi:HGxxPAAW family protein [Sinomonas sp. ASV486]|uniref:HGxxPAAW family protein n=1 Tax=Sinomonas puerhi TaxID=3238584 RepID=A0AB39L7E8_9MICC|nr:HGxxPAAW family protein [Sinomonas sp. ASV486]MDQ4489630.1 HGxxPAAW family protein [Sinomonas sp. ASV486]
MSNTRSSQAGTNEVMHGEDLGHGNSPAAWTCVFIMMLGSIVSCIAFAIANTPVFWAGIVVIAIGLVVGWAMRRAGYGVGGSKLKNQH